MFSGCVVVRIDLVIRVSRLSTVMIVLETKNSHRSEWRHWMNHRLLFSYTLRSVCISDTETSSIKPFKMSLALERYNVFRQQLWSISDKVYPIPYRWWNSWGILVRLFHRSMPISPADDISRRCCPWPGWRGEGSLLSTVTTFSLSWCSPSQIWVCSNPFETDYLGYIGLLQNASSSVAPACVNRRHWILCWIDEEDDKSSSKLEIHTACRESWRRCRKQLLLWVTVFKRTHPSKND